MLSNFMKKGNNLQEVPDLEPRAELGDAHPVEGGDWRGPR